MFFQKKINSAQTQNVGLHKKILQRKNKRILQDFEKILCQPF